MSKILAIDDNKDNLLVLEAYIKQYLPLQKLILAQSGQEGIARAIQDQPDVILLDINMPEMDGYTVCQKLRKNKNTVYIPIIMVTALHTDIESKIKGLELGANAFLYKPFQPVELISQIKVMLRIKQAEDKLRKEKMQLEDKVQKRTQELENAQKAAIQTISRILEIRDPHRRGNQYLIARLSKVIGKQLGLTKKQLAGLWFASLINDIGKLTIPADILNKPGKLNEVEYNIVKQHCYDAYELLKDLPYPWPIADIVLQHHENINGSGYPRGLKGKEILLEARILRVADTVVAMLSHRPYRSGYPMEKVLKELYQKSNIYYDPDVVQTCIDLFQDHKLSFLKHIDT